MNFSFFQYKYAKILIVIGIYIIGINTTQGQTQLFESKSWCKSKCNAAGDEKANTKDLYMRRPQIRNNVSIASTLKFPLRIALVKTQGSAPLSNQVINNTIQKLNQGFEKSGIQFYVDQIETIYAQYTVETISDNNYENYNEFSKQHDKSDQISVYIFDYDPKLCSITPSSISCSRTGGFSYVLSNKTNNIVLSRFDMEDDKVITHEMGHFFGLYHTFEEYQFGRDDMIGDCNILGDCLCDTPADPGAIFEVYINYSRCEMIGYHSDSGKEYKPMINNYMGYFKPCYLTPYVFSDEQANILRMAAESEYRNKFAK